ncbi:MAG: BlaI/MecI/CopY family transcriptional regulator [Acidobacteria bacterium]|nr:BlaI/MecI/CopY family transcriptional regulator [Acidobacteriota bacterium]MBV9475481.1 BlaI/MecI/CopY family transcriptional regulator [Acidobacteriota bacterium]
MARKASPTLTDAELRIMNVLWRLGRATVADVHRALAKHELAYTTVLTTIQVLETKGYVAHEAQGRAYVYRPVVQKQPVRRKAMRHFVSRWFGGSHNDLLLNVIEEQDLTPDEVSALMKVLRKKGKP